MHHPRQDNTYHNLYTPVVVPHVTGAKDSSCASWDRSCDTLISAHISVRWHFSSKINATKWPFPDLRKDNENHEGSRKIAYLDDNESCKNNNNETKLKT